MTPTTIAQLPQIAAQFVAAANGDWRDSIQFNIPPGEPSAGLPLDLTGIAFYVQVRDVAGMAGSNLMIDASTTAGTIVNGGQTGTMSMAVPQATMAKCKPGVPLVVDIVAVGVGPDGTTWTVNLSPTPSTLTINLGVTFVGT